VNARTRAPPPTRAVDAHCSPAHAHTLPTFPRTHVSRFNLAGCVDDSAPVTPALISELAKLFKALEAVGTPKTPSADPLYSPIIAIEGTPRSSDVQAQAPFRGRARSMTESDLTGELSSMRFVVSALCALMAAL
jgi:hypothetical protein